MLFVQQQQQPAFIPNYAPPQQPIHQANQNQMRSNIGGQSNFHHGSAFTSTDSSYSKPKPFARNDISSNR